jgi:hypothetical protein
MDINYCESLIRTTDAFIAALQQHRDKRSARLAAIEGDRTRHARSERDMLLTEIALIDDGCGPRDGTSAEHWDLLQRPEFRALNMVRPGLATLRAYRARLVQQREAELAKASA